MDLQPVQVPGKSQPPREKAGRKTNGPSRAVAARDPPVSRQKRVFGTSRSTNVPAKPATEKLAAKSATGVHRKQAQPASKSPSAVGAALASAAAEKASPERAEPKPKEKSVCFEEESPKNSGDAPAENTSPERADSKPKKKSVCFEEKSPKNLGDTPAVKTSPERANPKPKKKSVCFEEKLPKNWGDESAVGPRTPVQAPLASLVKPRRSGTPYHTAENCSKCRFDRLETASYWLSQIKLAEPVGKHFVSANFFQMALECKAEPIRSLCIELKRYLARHLHLSEEAEWRNLSLGYGILKDEPDSGPRNPDSGKASVRLSTGSNHEDREQWDAKDELIDSKGE